MSFVNTLRQWDVAVDYVDLGNYAEALKDFLDIQVPDSKISFNIGNLHLLTEDLDAAEKAFDCSICKDEHLAVAFFQRGITFLKKERFLESFSDFNNAYTELRGNQLIDYKPLGLRYKLYACEVLHNMALAQAHMGHWEKAQQNLVTALNLGTEAKLSQIDKALQLVLKQKLFNPIEVPAKVLFKPNKNYIAELEKKDYLGKAKVVASIVPQDEFSGFAPLQPQFQDLPPGPKTPEVLRALEGEPHTVLFEFIPETGDELGVVPGNVVFVLQKGADNWASVIFNGRMGLVPYNYLERLEITLSSKQDQDENHIQMQAEVPEPQRRPAPSRPERKYGVMEDSVSMGKTKGEEASERASCIVKVHFTYNIAIITLTGISYRALKENICDKLGLRAEKITLSYTRENSELKINEETMMADIWNYIHNGYLTLWCNVKKDKTEKTMKLLQPTQLMALHSYNSKNPEDLRFSKGDTIILLSKVNEEWFEGQCYERSGIFPSSFVEEVPKQRWQN